MRIVLPLLLSVSLAVVAGCRRAEAPPSAAPVEAALGAREACTAYDGLPAGWGAGPHAGMVWIEAGSVDLGSDRGYPDERPVVAAQVPGFWIDRTEVTNAQFAAFVKATNYLTVAERKGGSAVFNEPAADQAVTGPGSWWKLVPDATWRHPRGAGSGIAGRGHEPVVNVAYEDAQAYAQWLGRELPSELEWEFAAKAGRSNVESDASIRDAGQRPTANFWQGLFPYDNQADDGFRAQAPVGCYPPNPHGLYDMVGNVWEWTRDAYAARAGGVAAPSSGAPQQVIKGGSYLCAANYCARARAASRQGQDSDLPASHIGFRTIARR